MPPSASETKQEQIWGPTDVMRELLELLDAAGGGHQQPGRQHLCRGARPVVLHAAAQLPPLLLSLQPGRDGRQRQEAAAAERERGDSARRGDAVRGPARTMLRCQPTRRIWVSADGAHDRPFREARGCEGGA